VQQGPDEWLIYIPLLYADFANAIFAYRKALDTSLDLQKKFSDIYANYGTIDID